MFHNIYWQPWLSTNQVISIHLYSAKTVCINLKSKEFAITNKKRGSGHKFSLVTRKWLSYRNFCVPRVISSDFIAVASL